MESAWGRSRQLWSLSSHAPFQLRQSQRTLRRNRVGKSLLAGYRFTVKQIMHDPLPGAGLLSDLKFPLSQPKRDPFAAIVQNQKRNDLFTQGIFDLAGDGRLSVPENPAALHDSEPVCG